MLGLGKANKITMQDIYNLAQSINVDPAVIDGVGLTESNGSGWFPNGQLKILPEPHVFFAQLPTAKRLGALKLGLATHNYKETKDSGHYKRMTNGPVPRYAFFEKMIAYDEDAAYKSISSGSFQIMGFNHTVCGYLDAKTMFLEFCDSEAEQLNACINYIKSCKGGLRALQLQDFVTIEELYNGGGQGGAYAHQMSVNTSKARKARWNSFIPNQVSKDFIATTPSSTSKTQTLQEIKFGDISKDVEDIQVRLTSWGYNLKPDGKFGNQTLQAVRDFQGKKSLVVTGVVDIYTRAELYKDPDPEVTKAVEDNVTPVVVTQEVEKQVAVVPDAATKPWWKSWSIWSLGGTTIGGWFVNFIEGLEPWMKFVLLLIGIASLGFMIWHRQKLFNQAKDIIKDVQKFNDSLNSDS